MTGIARAGALDDSQRNSQTPGWYDALRVLPNTLPGSRAAYERKRAAAIVFEAELLGSAETRRQNRIEPVQCLGAVFSFRTEYGRVPRWIQIQADDVGSFGFKLRIVAGRIASDPARL